MASKGSTLKAEGNATLRTVCSSCGKSITTEVGIHPLADQIARETWGLVGGRVGRQTVFPTCDPCHVGGWRPFEFAGIN